MLQLRNTVLWKDSYLKFDHVPYVVVNHKVYDCQHGVDRHLSEKKKNIAVSFLKIVFHKPFLAQINVTLVCSFREEIIPIGKMEQENFFRNPGNSTAPPKCI